MRRVFVVRHGETDWNVAKRVQGMADIDLNAVGIEQAAAMARSLAPELGVNTTVVASPLGRTRDTALPLAELLGVPLELDVRLVERAYGIWEGLTDDERKQSHPTEHADWAVGKEPLIAGFEGHETVAVRMVAAVNEWLGRTEGDLVTVTHGSSARMLILDLLGLAHGSLALGNLGNGAWSEIVRHRADTWTLTRHNLRGSR